MPGSAYGCSRFALSVVWFGAWPKGSLAGSLPGRPREVAGAVMSASRYVPRATCLVRALTVQALLEAQGWPAWLRIGVAGAPGWAAHAWVEDAHGPVTEADPGVAGTYQS